MLVHPALAVLLGLASAWPDPRSSPGCDPASLQCSLPSLGRKVSLGHGWDVRGGRVVAGTAPWNSETIAEKQVNQTNLYKEILFQKETDSSERAERLSVEANLEVNVLSGMVQVDAGGKYLTSQKQSSTTVRLLLDYDSKNYFSTMPFTETPVDESNKDFCSTDNLATVGGPTHVITSVQYGTKAFVLFEREVLRGEEEEEISFWMNFAIAASVVDVNSSLDFNYTNSYNHSTSSISLHFLGNTLVNSPTSLEDVNQCIDDLDASSRDNPQPLSFTLTRIDQICSAADVVFASIGNPTLDRLANILRSFADNRLRTDTLLIDKNSVAQRHVLKEALVGPGSFGGKLEDFEAEVKMNLSKLLVEVRSNVTDECALISIIQEVDKSPFEKFNAGTFLEYFENQVSSFDIFYQAPNVQVDDAEGSIQNACLMGGAKDTYTFILNVLPKSNLASDFFDGTLDTDSRWIKNPSEVGAKFSQFRWKAFETSGNFSCFVVDLAELDPDHPVTFRVVDMFGNIQEDNDNLPDIGERQVTLDTARCRWVNGYNWGDLAACAQDELSTGACAGGGGFGHKDCKGGAVVHSLLCCPVSQTIPLIVKEDNCTTISSGYGQPVDCFSQTQEALTVHRSCSSGAYHDCPLPDGTADTNRVDCCSSGYANGMAVGARGEGDCGQWQYGGFGQDLVCPEDSVLVARCGSGMNHDCPHSSSHGIKCCSLFVL